MQGRHVLLVEDDFIISMDIQEHLADRGYTVDAVSCAAAAIESLAGGRGLSALVCDVELGVGDDGFAVARRARAAYPGLPVVFISATSGARHGSEGVAGSVFIAKPLHPRQVAAALDRLMNQPVPDPAALRLPTAGGIWPGAMGGDRILRRQAA